MYKVVMHIDIRTKTKEQAEYIQKFFDDAQALMSCENSEFRSSGVEEVARSETRSAPEIILITRPETDEVFNKLRQLIAVYGFVTISDLYELVGIASKFEDTRWGWSDLKEADVAKILNDLGAEVGFKLLLPKPKLYR